MQFFWIFLDATTSKANRVIIFSIFLTHNSKLERTLKALCNNVKTKAYLHELGIKLSKLVKTSLNAGIQ